MTTRELIEQRAKLIADMRSIVAQADAAKRELTPEEDAKWNAMDADADRLKSTISKRTKLEAEEREIENPGAKPIVNAPATGHLTSEERAKKENQAFTAWLRYGLDGLSAEQKHIMAQKRTFVNLNGADMPAEVRAQSTTTTAGGYTVPQGF